MSETGKRILEIRKRIALAGVTHKVTIKQIAREIGRNYNYVLDILTQRATSNPVLTEIEEFLNGLEDEEDISALAA